MGYSSDSYYRFKKKKLHDEGGEAALHEISRKKPIEMNRVEPHVEQGVINMAYEYPAYGQQKAKAGYRHAPISIALKQPEFFCLTLIF